MGEDREAAWLSAAAVECFYGEEPASLSDRWFANEIRTLLVDQAAKDGRDVLRAAMTAITDLGDRNGGTAMQQAGADLEDAIAGELSRDKEFAARLRAAVAVFDSLRGPRSRRPPRPDTEKDNAVPRDADPILDAALWVAAAAGSGVLGNAAYDAVKAAFRKHLRGRTGSGTVADAGPPYSRDHLILIARLAVQARCGELSIVVPRITELHCTEVATGESRTTMELAAPWVQATVVVPNGGFDSPNDISVTLYTAGDGPGNGR